MVQALTKEDYTAIAWAIVEQEKPNMKAALTACGIGNTNGYRIKSNPLYQEALAEVRMKICQETNLSKQKVVDMVNSVYDEINGRNMCADASDAAKLANVKLNCIDRLIKIGGFEAPLKTEHTRLEGSAKDLSDLVEKVGERQKKEAAKVKEITVVQEDA